MFWPLNLLFSRPSRHQPRSTTSAVAVLERPGTINVMSAGQGGKIKEPLLIGWPTRAECQAARGTPTPVVFIVSFDGEDQTEIPVYVDSCTGTRDGKILIVSGVTGRGRLGMDVSVAYDYASFSWGLNFDPDCPRQIMYH